MKLKYRYKLIHVDIDIIIRINRWTTHFLCRSVTQGSVLLGHLFVMCLDVMKKG